MSRSIASTATNRQKYKIVFLGDQGVGKSSIIERFVNDVFDNNCNPTVGIDFMVRNITHKGKNYRLQLWDTAGQERFRSLIPGYLKDAMCAIFVCDASKPDSTSTVQDWMNLFNQHKMSTSVSVLCSNKIDIAQNSQQIDYASKQAKRFNINHFKVSAKTGQNIQQMFNSIIDLVVKKQSSKDEPPINPPVQSPKFQKKQEIQRQDSNQMSQPVAITPNPITLNASQMQKNHRQKSKCC